jgi:hypothetical protein
MLRALPSIVVGIIFVGCSSPNPLGTFAGRYNGASSIKDAGSTVASGTATNGDDDSDPQPSAPQPTPPVYDGGDQIPEPDGGYNANRDAAPAIDASPISDASTLDPIVQHCVDAINGYRAQVGVPAYALSPDVESFATSAASSDAQSGNVHGYFHQNNGGGVSSAESELPGYPLNGGTVQSVIDQGLSDIWNEGQGGAHYQQLTSTQFTTVGCGYALSQDQQSVWVTFDYH